MRAPIRRAIPCIIPLLATALLSCGAGEGIVPAGYQARSARSAGAGAAIEQGATAMDALASQVESMWLQQQLVRSGELRIEVDSVALAIDRADSIAAAGGGLLADVAIWRDSARRSRARLVMRVPAGRFGETQSALRALGEVESESVNTEDVTKAYADLETRIAVKEEAVARLRRLLAEQTGALSDVLDVERELSRAVAELEGLKGERRYYDQRIVVSTIGVTLLEPGAPLQASTSVANAFRTSLALLTISVSRLLYVLTSLLPWLVLAALVWAVVRWTPRMMRRTR